MPFSPRPHFTWQLRTRTRTLGPRTLLMGILNVTPDSFSDGNRFFTPHAALDHALQLLDGGADLIDLGGESTRPGANPVTAEEEQSRILPVLKAILRARPATIVSVDTYHASTAEAALHAGAEIINDVSGLLWDPRMAEVLATHRPGAILMHSRGTPATWSTLPPLAPAEILPLVTSGLAQTLAHAHVAGIPPGSIVLDPGFGFGKLGDENFTLLAHLDALTHLGCPLLAGLSRKRFLAAHHPPTPASIETSTTAANTAAILAGAHLLRVHDIPAARAAATIADRLLLEQNYCSQAYSSRSGSSLSPPASSS